jgi:hypothetical protein
VADDVQSEGGTAVRYMVINRHAPESCAFRGEDEAQHLEPAFERLEQLASEHGVHIEGRWINPPGHEAFLLVDAPDPHTIDGLLVESGLVGRTHTRIVSVLAIDEVVTPHTAKVASATASR